MFGAMLTAATALTIAACSSGGSSGGYTPPSTTPTPKPTPAALQQQSVSSTSGGTVSASLPGGGTLSVQVPANSLSTNATITIYAYTSLSQMQTTTSLRRRNTASSVPSGGTFLAGFAIDTGGANLLKPLQVTETLQGAVPSGDVLRVAHFGTSGYTDVDTATATASAAANDLNKNYVSVSGGGTAAPYIIYAIAPSAAASPAPIAITIAPAQNQQIVIGGTGSFTVSGADKNGNTLPFVPVFDTDNHAVATAAAGSSLMAASVQATAQGGVVDLLATDSRTGVTGKQTFTVYTQRPANAGDAFAFTGTLNQSATYAYPKPTLPPSNVTANVTQSVSVSATANPFGPGTAQDFKTVEADAYPTQTLTTTTDYYYQLANANFELLGYNAVDDQGNTTSVSYSTPQIVDKLPEASGASWSNSPAMVLKQNFAGQEQATRTVDADGTYTDTETIYQGSGQSGTYPAMQIVLSDAKDGSGSFSFTYNFTGTPYNPPYTSETYEWTTSAPHVPSPAPSATPGAPVIDVYETRLLVQATPVPSPSPAYQFSLNQWYPAALALYSESDSNKGSATIPAACAVPSGFGTTATQIEQQVNRLDTALGTMETTTTDSYVAMGFGPVCVQVHDQTQTFYDFNNDTGYNWYYSSTPMSTATIAETLTLQTQGTSTSPQDRSRMSAGPLQPVSPAAVALAQQHVQMLVQRNRSARLRSIGRAIYKAIVKGGHRL